MFDSVLFARDKWLKPDGKMFPSRANIYLAPFTDDNYYHNERISFWSNEVYGWDFSPIIPYARRLAFCEPIVDVLPSQDVLAWPIVMKSFDCKTVTQAEVISGTFDFKFPSMIVASLNGFAVWFDVLFEGTNATLRLTTAPESTTTHWKQTLLYIADPVKKILQDTIITGTISYSPNKENKRYIDIDLSYKVQDNELKTYNYKMI